MQPDFCDGLIVITASQINKRQGAILSLNALCRPIHSRTLSQSGRCLIFIYFTLFSYASIIFFTICPPTLPASLEVR